MFRVLGSRFAGRSGQLQKALICKGFSTSKQVITTSKQVITPKQPRVIRQGDIETADTNVYLCCDTNLMIYYANKTHKAWCHYVDRILEERPGEHRLFYLESQVHEYKPDGKRGSPPPEFKMLKDSHGTILEAAFKDLARVTNLSMEYEHDAKLFLQGGACLNKCEDIPDEAVIARKNLLVATANCDAVRRLLRTPEKRRLFETIVDNFGLEHLADVRYVTCPMGYFEDVGAFSDYDVPTKKALQAKEADELSKKGKDTN
jgi:hypothetical protein